MGTVHTTIYGKEYALGCDDGQEQQLAQLAEKLNQRCTQLGGHLGRVPDALMLIYAGLTFLDESNEANKKLEKFEGAAQSPESDLRLHSMQEDLASHLSELAQKIEKIADNLEEAA